MNTNSFETSSTDHLTLGDCLTEVTADTGSTVNGWKERIREMQSCWNFFNSLSLLVVNVILSYLRYFNNMTECSKFWNCCLIWYKFFLLLMYYTCTYPDIDECAEKTAGCNHNCTNNIGSFVCSCFIGYHLIEDMRTCVGKSPHMRTSPERERERERVRPEED